MTYDHWKTTNPEDRYLGASDDPDIMGRCEFCEKLALLMPTVAGPRGRVEVWLCDDCAADNQPQEDE